MRNGPVLFSAISSNRKLSPVKLERSGGKKRIVLPKQRCSATYVSISGTCPTACAYKDNGCFVQSQAAPMRALDEASESWTPLEIIEEEAAMIDRSFPRGIPKDGLPGGGGRDLRLHVGGDASCAQGAKALADATGRWMFRSGGAVWTYTHRWRRIHRRNFGLISALASVEKPSDLVAAREQGYASAITVVAFESERAYSLGTDGFTVIPCPAETRGTTCIECRLCFDDARLRKEKLVIGFALHGPKVRRATERLVQLGTNAAERDNR